MSFAKVLSLLKLDSLLFHDEEATAKEESSRYFFFQKSVAMFFGNKNLMLPGNFSHIFEKTEGLYFEEDNFTDVPGSALSGSLDFRRLGGCSGSSSSEDAGPDDMMLPKGKSTSHSFGLATKVRAAVLVSSSLLGIRRSSRAMSEERLI